VPVDLLAIARRHLPGPRSRDEANERDEESPATVLPRGELSSYPSLGSYSPPGEPPGWGHHLAEVRRLLAEAAELVSLSGVSGTHPAIAAAAVASAVLTGDIETVRFATCEFRVVVRETARPAAHPVRRAGREPEDDPAGEVRPENRRGRHPARRGVAERPDHRPAPAPRHGGVAGRGRRPAPQPAHSGGAGRRPEAGRTRGVPPRVHAVAAGRKTRHAGDPAAAVPQPDDVLRRCEAADRHHPGRLRPVQGVAAHPEPCAGDGGEAARLRPDVPARRPSAQADRREPVRRGQDPGPQRLGPPAVHRPGRRSEAARRGGTGVADDHRAVAVRRPPLPVGGAVAGVAAHRLGARAADRPVAEDRAVRREGNPYDPAVGGPPPTPGRSLRAERRRPDPRRRREPPGEGKRADGVEELQPADDVREAGAAGGAGPVAAAVPQPPGEPGDGTAGAVPGSRRRAVDGARREGEPEALRPDDGRPLRPGGARRRIRRTGGAKSGAAAGRGESQRT
jgi:hypothetical protein